MKKSMAKKRTSLQVLIKSLHFQTFISYSLNYN